ncbi:MAG TPA: SagB family peptide dehydrogenase [Actinophytocola sp.]|nr:SagB family peptide dehydrogenase [Actinophytocola sp.]
MTDTLATTPEPAVLPAEQAPDQLGTVGNDDTTLVREYAEAVFRRNRVPMEPIAFEIDWVDQPSRHKTYLGVTRLPLPPAGTAGPAGVLLDRSAEVPRADWDLGKLATLLRLSYGVLDRRMKVNWNQDADKRTHLPAATWGRGTASGGGMYPIELYVVSGAGGPLLPGVYHYATAHHELERLVAGDLTAQVRAATGQDGDLFLLAAVRFWKNSFKYNSFCYHVVTQDAGALAGSLDAVVRAMGHRADRALWFDEQALDRLLGLDTATESVLAVLPLRQDATPAATEPPAGEPPTVDHQAFERSTRLLRFPLVDKVHAASMVGAAPRPATALAGPRPAAELAADSVELPAPLTEPFAGDLAGVLRTRRSSFGGFTSAPPLGLDQLATLLASGATGAAIGSDIKPAGDRLTRLFVLANRVDGLAGGGYAYDPDGHRLHRVLDPNEPTGALLQRHYLLTNYNTEQAAAVIAISGRLEEMLAGFGNRGYRMLNSEVGAVAQTCYLAATALGVGCGAVLGLDNVALDDLLGIGPEHGDDERTLLFLLVGPERSDPADVDLRLE